MSIKYLTNEQVRKEYDKLWDKLIGYQHDTEYAEDLTRLLKLESELALRGERGV